MHAYLIYSSFYSKETGKVGIGGIETYICDLCDIFLEKGYEVSVVQMGKQRESITWNNINIIVIPGELKNLNTYIKGVRKYLLQNLLEEDVVVFMTHSLNFSLPHKKTISVQHGIFWDIPSKKPKSNALIELCVKAYQAWKTITSVNKVRNTVAVDYNFLNWYRTQQHFMRTKIVVVPNYSKILPKKPHKNIEDRIKIIFSRRMTSYRGTRIFATAIKKLLEDRDCCEVTFAGTGPDLEYLKSMFENNKRVRFITYSHEESLEVHSQNDIAVVPSVGSEGTSLSLLEAMASGCAVVATNVGGMTNIILDGYNGLISDTTATSLYNSLLYLVDNKEEIVRMSDCAYATVSKAFSKEKWKKEWSEIIDNCDQ